jgi:type II secretory pathway component GspD/PulD (secretin)
VRVTWDTSTNSLIMQAQAADMWAIRKLLEALDAKKGRAEPGGGPGL